MSARDDKGELDIKHLLALALSEEPSEDLPERVLNRLAGVNTAVEFGRMLGLAPMGWSAADDEDRRTDEPAIDPDDPSPSPDDDPDDGT